MEFELQIEKNLFLTCYTYSTWRKEHAFRSQEAGHV